jgi:inosose dehydratase
VGLTLDTAHLHMAGEDDIATVIVELADVIDNIHLKDYRAGARRFPSKAEVPNTAEQLAEQFTAIGNPFAALGEGEIDFNPIFASLARVRYTGWLCVDEESGADIATSMRSSNELVRRLLDS